MNEVSYPTFPIRISENPNYDPVRGKCALVSFSYNEKLIQLIKGIPGSLWNGELKCWDLRWCMVRVFLRQLKNKAAQLELNPQIMLSDTIVNSMKSKDINLTGIKWKTKPFQHQIDAVKFAIKNPRFILGDEQGCGKTKEIIDYVHYLKTKGMLKHALIICGVNGNKYNWEDEVSLHSNYHGHIIGTHRGKRSGKLIDGGLAEVISDLRNPPEATFYIMNIEKLRGGHVKRKRGQRKSIKEFPVAEMIQQLINSGEIGLVAFDEFHKVKSPTSAQAQALLWIQCPRMVAMTGTLIMNSPLDLYMPFKWLGFENRDYWFFENHYAVKDMWGSVIGYQNAQELIDVLSAYQLRRLKKDVLDLPDKIHHSEWIEMTTDEWKVYNAIQSALLDLLRGDVTNPAGLKEGLFSNMLDMSPMTLSMRLRQATACTSLVSDKLTISSKLDRMEELVEEIVSGDCEEETLSDGTVVTHPPKAIIFSNWSQVTDLAVKRLERYNPAYIWGGVSQEARNEERHRFQEDNNCLVIVGTSPALGTGFTLTAAKAVIFLDEPWTQAQKAQCEDRAHRAGMRWPVDIYTLMCKGTVDEAIHEIVESKGDIADLVVDGVVNPNKKEQLLKILIGADPFK